MYSLIGGHFKEQSGHQLQATYTYLAGFSSYPTAEEWQEPTPGFLQNYSEWTHALRSLMADPPGVDGPTPGTLQRVRPAAGFAVLLTLLKALNSIPGRSSSMQV